MKKRILLLGSGELGKEVVVAAQNLGHEVIAVDHYAHAPAMQMSAKSEVINMLSGDELQSIVQKHRPHLIVPEIEAIRIDKLLEFEKQGIQVVPSARAVEFAMNRKKLRVLAAEELGFPTARFYFATTLEEVQKAARELNYPFLIKPLMSSSGKGQSVVYGEEEVEQAFRGALRDSRGDIQEVICEEFLEFDSEITLLTITQEGGPTLFCPPIGHIQEDGDYRMSWMPHSEIREVQFKKACEYAEKITANLGGAGIWGVEFFLKGDEEVFFSELSPRPHDTGMVTLAKTLPLNEFELHVRAILGLPIPELKLEKHGVSQVVLAPEMREESFQGQENVVEGVTEAMQEYPQGDIRIFGKQQWRANRRLGVLLASAEPDRGLDVESLKLQVGEMGEQIQIR